MPRKPAAPDYTTPPEDPKKAKPAIMASLGTTNDGHRETDPVVAAMRDKRKELIALPLDKIYRELFEAGKKAEMAMEKERLYAILSEAIAIADQHESIERVLTATEQGALHKALRRSTKLVAKGQRVAPAPASESPPKTPVVKHTPEKIARVLMMLSGGQHTNVVAMACGLSADAVRGIWRRHGKRKLPIRF
jgi:hypothetical protein